MKLYQLLLIISKYAGLEIWLNDEKLYGGIKGNVPFAYAENCIVKHVSVSHENRLIIEVDCDGK